MVNPAAGCQSVEVLGLGFVQLSERLVEFSITDLAAVRRALGGVS
jgi:hypothetical protein